MILYDLKINGLSEPLGFEFPYVSVSWKVKETASKRAVKARLWLDDAPHVCTISPEYPKIVQAMDEFLRKAEQG